MTSQSFERDPATESRRAHVRRLAEAGWSQRKIARELGIHKSTVVFYLGKHKRRVAPPKKGLKRDRTKFPTNARILFKGTFGSLIIIISEFGIHLAHASYDVAREARWQKEAA